MANLLSWPALPVNRCKRKSAVPGMLMPRGAASLPSVQFSSSAYRTCLVWPSSRMAAAVPSPRSPHLQGWAQATETGGRGAWRHVFGEFSLFLMTPLARCYPPSSFQKAHQEQSELRSTVLPGEATKREGSPLPRSPQPRHSAEAGGG